MINMQEWLLLCYEDGYLTKRHLKEALSSKSSARDLWFEFCDSDDLIQECQDQIEQFLEMLDDIT